MKPRWREIALTYSRNQFSEFFNHPEYRGEKFTWERFPDMMERLFRSSFFVYYANPKVAEKYVERSTKVMRANVLRLMKENGL